MKICRLSAADRKAFCALFAEYYQELGCDEDIDHLLDEYVLADFDAGLLDIAVAQEGGAAFGFVIWQTDRAENVRHRRGGRCAYLRSSRRRHGLILYRPRLCPVG